MTVLDEVLYEVIVWDYDGAPDGGGYYIWKRIRGLTQTEAARRAYDFAGDHEDATAVGAGIFLGGERVKGYGVTGTYPKN